MSDGKIREAHDLLDRLVEAAAVPRSLRDFRAQGLNSRCIVRLDPPPEKSSLIKLTDEEIVTLSGIVVSVGCKVTQPLLGERVHFHKYYGVDLYFKGQMFKAVNEEDLLLIEPKEAFEESQMVHGASCPKMSHLPVAGYLHDAEDDSPYDVDGVKYCGRCHHCL